MEREALDRAIEKAGGIAKFASALGVSESAVWKWRYGQKQARAERALDIERMYGVPREELMPKLFLKAS